MSAETVMAALQAVLPAGTPVQQTVIETELDLYGGGWPALLLACPRTQGKREATGRWAETHEVFVFYFDRWETSGRTAGQITADCRAALEQMKANVLANKMLTVNAVANALVAGDEIDTEVLGIAEEFQGKALPFPMVVGCLRVLVWDLWQTK